MTTCSQFGLRFVLASGVAVATMGLAADWPVWRGPNADGISRETGWNPQALADGPKVLWERQIGHGYAAVAVRDGKVYALGNDGRQDVVFCLDAKTGEEVWRYSYDCPPGGGYRGPRASPVLDGPAVFTYSQDGQVHCLNADGGQLIWRKHVTREYGAQSPKWNHAASPLVLGQLLVLNAGRGGLALNKQTGERIWGGIPGIGGYATPVAFRMGDTPALAIFAEKELLVVAAATGDILAQFPWQTAHDVNAADPLPIGGDRLFISSGYRRGGAMLDTSDGRLEKVWENREMSNHFTSSVFFDGYLYGVDGNAGRGVFKCLDPRDGSVKWEEKTGFGSFVLADGKLIILNEAGKLMIAEATPTGYRELAAAQTPLTRTCWTMPVLSHGLLYGRNDKGHLVCIDVR